MIMSHSPIHLTFPLSAILGLLLLTATPAFAQLDRPDLLDVDDETFAAASSDLKNGVDYSFAYAGADAYDSISASGVAYGTSASGWARVNWHIFEPDQVKRKSNGLQIKQRNHLGFAMQISDGSTTASFSSTSIEGCKAKVKVAGETTNTTNTKWVVKCPKDVLDSMGLTPAQQATMDNIFGGKLKFVNKGTNVP